MKVCNDDSFCTGCMACEKSCPKQAISIKTNSEGFIYPVIDLSNCVECNACRNVCPINNKPKCEKGPRSAYIARIRDEKARIECTSGGAVTAMAEKVIMRHGVVYGAVYDENMKVVHKRIVDIQDLHAFSGSKYVQSDLGDVFESIKKDMQMNKMLLFCGTPCQTAGLVNYLHGNTNGIILVDFVCHGVPSPMLWDQYIKCQKYKYGTLKAVNFRSKQFGYHVATMQECYDSGRKVIGSARTNMMLRCYFNDIADREACYKCQFKTINRCTDLTVFDSWHASAICSRVKDDNKGFTNIIVQSSKGKDFLLQCEDKLELFEGNLEMAVQLDGNMVCNSVTRPKVRDVFYQELYEIGLIDTVDKYLHITYKDYLIDRIKYILNCLGLTALFKKK